ncbi:hypothetical protein [Silvibacterium dinghuense]|uniref:hypothetical protein n=1 Tax=Silvibacterium dinghuense TaxID=1560006 RepID=UPI0013E91CC2|nr:hypothetical protein [Silvibacterium dinghuense]GGH02793.1 hypothetical protein GCM10011586_18310 [Silvibacterium dinghuense]
MEPQESEKSAMQRSGPGWALMLALLAVAMIVAALIAYRMIYPFFHRPAHSLVVGQAAAYLSVAVPRFWARAACSTGMPSSRG